MAVQGPRGVQGNQGNMGNQGGQGSRGAPGERGAAGLSRSVRRALVYLFMLAAFLGALSLFWTAHEVHASQAAIHAEYVHEQAAQQRAGVMLGQRLCTTFGRLAELKPPAGNPKTNPSRAFDDNLHATLDQLGTDLGCR